MKKSIASRLRKNEEIELCSAVSVRIKEKWRDCYIALISCIESNNRSELALFLFKPSRRYIIQGKIELLTVMPVVHELTLIPETNGFIFRWRDFSETQYEIITKDKLLYENFLDYVCQAATYQREPFKLGSATHQWVWHYQDSIHPKIKGAPKSQDPIFSNRKSVRFQPEHYGSEMMNTYIKEQLVKRESEYIRINELSIFIGIWNCGGTGPEQSLVPWLRTSKPPDLIAVFFQEMCKLNAKNILGDENREVQWQKFVSSQVANAFPGVEYINVFSQSLVGLLSLGFVKASLRDKIKNLKSCLVKLGFKGYAGNKGAVCIRMDYLSTSICFINCHLAAHKPKIDKRNKQVRQIFREASFIIKKKPVSIFEHDYVFFAGDLNYRVHVLTDLEIREAINSGNFAILLQCDQLLYVQANENILTDFREANINFPPSYKFKKGTNCYIEGRDPAWCDRILSRGPVTYTQYRICMDICQSDHKPVMAESYIPIKIVMNDAKEKIKAEIFTEMSMIYESFITNS